MGTAEQGSDEVLAATGTAEQGSDEVLAATMREALTELSGQILELTSRVAEVEGACVASSRDLKSRVDRLADLSEKLKVHSSWIDTQLGELGEAVDAESQRVDAELDAETQRVDAEHIKLERRTAECEANELVLLERFEGLDARLADLEGETQLKMEVLSAPALELGSMLGSSWTNDGWTRPCRVDAWEQSRLVQQELLSSVMEHRRALDDRIGATHEKAVMSEARSRVAIDMVHHSSVRTPNIEWCGRVAERIANLERRCDFMAGDLDALDHVQGSQWDPSGALCPSDEAMAFTRYVEGEAELDAPPSDLKRQLNAEPGLMSPAQSRVALRLTRWEVLQELAGALDVLPARLAAHIARELPLDTEEEIEVPGTPVVIPPAVAPEVATRRRQAPPRSIDLLDPASDDPPDGLPGEPVEAEFNAGFEMGVSAVHLEVGKLVRRSVDFGAGGHRLVVMSSDLEELRRLHCGE